MEASDVGQVKFRKGFLLILVLAVSAAFVAMIARFLIPLFLATIFAGATHPIYRRLLPRLRGRAGLASFVTISVALVLIVAPLVVFLGMIAEQAVDVSEKVRPWIESQVQGPSGLEEKIYERLPVLKRLHPYRDKILQKLGEAAGQVGAFLFRHLAAAATGTMGFFLDMFVMLYAAFFFLIRGRATLDRAMAYIPLSEEHKGTLLARFVSVTRATIKGTLLIGLLQGALGGLCFAVVGIHGAVFWGAVMAVFSFVPGVGMTVVWIPAAIYLLASGQPGAAAVVALWCGGFAGSIDNLLRPRLVGKDTELPTLMTLLGTLGGLFLFGATGIIIGPILASLFLTVWEMYGVAFPGLMPPGVPSASTRVIPGES